MTDPTGRFHLVFNGEIYNHKELRALLQSHGVSFRTVGDTEVLLQGLIRLGPQFLDRLEGMYAFVFWDEVQRSAIIARDPFGIKPLYTASLDGVTFFASEPAPLREIVPYSINPEAIADLLTFRHLPSGLSPFSSIRELHGGHALVGSPSNFRTLCFADPLALLEDHSNEHYSATQEEVEDALRSSIVAHLDGDVPVGLQLSGGVDSSFVAAVSSSYPGGPRHSFGVQIVGSGHDEGVYREAVVKHCTLSHEEIPFNSHSFADLYIDTITKLDMPSAHYGCVALSLFFREVQSKFKVILTGEGADEMFGGYSRYVRCGEFEPVSAGATNAPGEDSVIFASAYIKPSRLKGIFPSLPFTFEKRRQIASRFADVRRQMMALDHEAYLSSLLMRQDRLSMAYGVEARVPFIHWPLAKTLSRVPLNDRMPASETKGYLKTIASKYLPHNVIHRRKNGLVLPIEDWLLDDRGLGRYLTTITDSACQLGRYTDHARLKALVERFRQDKVKSDGSILMRTLNVELWLRSLSQRRLTSAHLSDLAA
jgi:asparagine synthase (glutamine-hydrolysing)